MNNIINDNKSLIPNFVKKEKQLYIFITSFNLGGAERIVADQLWANYHQKQPHNITLILLYNKENEHPIPKNVNVVRLNGNINNLSEMCINILKNDTSLVCHLINDKTCNYLFEKNIKFHLVIHNDQKGWKNSIEVLNHKNIISLISVCQHVTDQLSVVTDKKIYTVRHQIKNSQASQYNQDMRISWRKRYNLKNSDIVIGMTGRICQQKNYFLALDIIAFLSRKNPNYKLLILGGFEKTNTDLYLNLLKKANNLHIQKHVIFAGFQIAYTGSHSALDIGLNVSHYEGLSMATQEFIQNGLPFVASNVSGQKEILDIRSQIQFFDFTKEWENLSFENITIDDIKNENSYTYLNMVQHISNIIDKNHSKRVNFSKEEDTYIKQVSYGSHNLWSIFNFVVNNNKNEKIIKPLFLTSNLNLGGAQRSLTNLLVELKKSNNEIPLCILNQSNYTGFYDQILHHNIQHYLCHEEKDVFLIFANLLDYINKNEINRVILWNVDSKIKLLLNKMTQDFIDIIDVSPGDYCFKEMDDQISFQDAIYMKKEMYFKTIHSFVSKFDNSHLDQDYKKHTKRKTLYIPNGVKTFPNLNPTMISDNEKTRFLVCGRITQSKHIDVILSAFESLYKKNNNVMIDIYGSCESYNFDYLNNIKSEFKSLIENQVINFKGNIEDPSSILNNYHSIVVLGTHQGCPNMVLESAAKGLFIIANDSGGTKEIINNDRGILLPEKPCQLSLEEAMLFVTKNHDICFDKGIIAKKHVENNFSMVNMRDKYIDLIFNQ